MQRTVQNWVLVLMLSLSAIFAAMPTMAQDNLETRSLDALFTLLKQVPNETDAQKITDAIWQRWMKPEDEVLSTMMEDALELQGNYNLRGAVSMYDHIIANYPDYAEAWNQRATLNFMLGYYDKSLADIDETLKREPRHFGALAGQSVIYLQQGKNDMALESIKKALKIHPFLSERHLFPQLMDPPTRT